MELCIHPNFYPQNSRMELIVILDLFESSAHIIPGLVFLIIGALYAIYRLIKNSSSKLSGPRLLRKVRSNPGFARKVSGRLDFFYGTIQALNTERFDSVVDKIKENEKLGKYTVIGTCKVELNKYLFITWYQDLDLNIGVRGRATDIKRVLQINFLVVNNTGKDKYEVYSDIYETLEEKNIKTIFATELFSTIDQDL